MAVKVEPNFDGVIVHFSQKLDGVMIMFIFPKMLIV